MKQITKLQKLAGLLKENQDNTNYDDGAYKAEGIVINIEDGVSYVDFAKLVADVIKNGYGSHLIDGFMEELSNELKPSSTTATTPYKKFKDEWGNSDWRDTGEMGG